MTCPSCTTDVHLDVQHGQFAICPGCCHTLVINGESVRLAVKEDALSLTAQDRMRIRRMRVSMQRERGMKVREGRRR